MARIADRVPGFGGVFRDLRTNTVYIYLQDGSRLEDTKRVLTEVFGTYFNSGSEVEALEGEYSMAHLEAVELDPPTRGTIRGCHTSCEQSSKPRLVGTNAMSGHRQNNVNRIVQWVLPFFAGLALAMATIACGSDPGNTGPAAQPAASDQEGDPSEIVRSVTTEDDKHIRRQKANVENARLMSPDTLVVNAGTCYMNPEGSFLEETDINVQIMMEIDFHPPRLSYPECLTEVIVQLDSPLGDRVLVDQHTGSVVSVTPVAGASTVASQHEEAVSQQSELVPQDIREAVSDAELQDLQAVAEQYGMTLREAFDRYAWNDEFSRAVQRVRAAAPESFTGAEIVDATNAWIAFTGTPPKAVLDMINAFTTKHTSVSVEVRTGHSLTEAEIEEAVPAVHYAVYKAPKVIDAFTSFDPKTNEIKSTVVLAETAPDSVVDELRAIAEKRLAEVTRPDILDSISVSIVRSPMPVIVIKD